MNSRINSFFLLTGFLLAPVISISQELSIVSWNLKDFGQSRDDQEITLIAREIDHADIVAIQEVVAKHPGGAQAVARLADQLNRMGAKWDYRISDPTRSSSPHKSERYAFLWKTSKVQLLERPVLVSELSGNVEREPFLAHFSFRGKKLSILNYHACTHKSDFPERQEIEIISKWITSQFFSNILWVGDMNLVINDIAFDHCKANGFSSLLNGQKTSLKRKCKSGVYLSRAEDNILFKMGDFNLQHYKVLDFISLGDCSDISWKRNSYSDHLGIEINVEL